VPSTGPADFTRVAWGTRTFLMGVLNVTPDSFSGDGLHRDLDAIVARAREIEASGADIIDVGGESTRPGHTPVTAAEELARVLPAVEAVRAAIRIPISVDTSKSTVAVGALAAGASIINDVSGLGDPEMAVVAATHACGLVIVHPEPVDPVAPLTSLVRALAQRVSAATAAGVSPGRVVIDPGLGMGKNWLMNFEIIRRLHELRALGLPILVGPSRKGMIGKVLGVGPHDRMEGTAALVTMCIAGGTDAVRVHDVLEMKRVAVVADALVRSAP